MIGFRLNIEMAQEFFNRCAAEKAETLEQRLQILQKMVSELKAIKYNDQDIKRVIKNKKVVRIKPKENN